MIFDWLLNLIFKNYLIPDARLDNPCKNEYEVCCAPTTLSTNMDNLPTCGLRNPEGVQTIIDVKISGENEAEFGVRN